MSKHTKQFAVTRSGTPTQIQVRGGETNKYAQSSSHKQSARVVDKRSKELQAVAAPSIQNRENDAKQLLERLAAKDEVISQMETELKSLRNAVRLNDALKTGTKGKEDERVRNLQEKLKQTKEDLRKWQMAYDEIKGKLQDATKLLEIRTTELKAAQTYLSREDAIPESDVIQSISDLNFEIMQASAILVDDVSSKLTRGAPNFNRTVQAEAEKTVSGFFGTRGLNLLRGVKDTEKTVDLVEIAFKACFVTWAREVIKSWEFQGSSVDLDVIYNAISSAEDQAVAGRWRALTRRNLQRPVSDDQVLKTIVSVLVSGLVSILVCAGISTGYSEATKLVASSVEARLNVVARLALQVNRIIGQDITSSDLEVYLVAPEGKFNIESMESSYNDEASGPAAKRRRKNDQVVLCTTDLGLTSRVKRPNRTQKILVKPAVVLEGFFVGL